MIPFRPLVRSLFLSAAGHLTSKFSPGVHILNGHVISFCGGGKRATFDRQLAQLRQECRFINIEEAVSLIKNKVQVDETLVAFTFDDGYAECYTDIAPALDKHDVNAAFFINPNLVDCSSEYKQEFFAIRVPDVPVREAMGQRMIEDLAARGFIIGAHTLDHLRLVGLSPQQIRQQIVDCKHAVEALTKQSCDYFAWTYGKFSDIDAPSLALALEHYQHLFSSDQYHEYSSREGVFNRRHFEGDWPISHLRYFLSTKRSWKQ